MQVSQPPKESQAVHNALKKFVCFKSMKDGCESVIMAFYIVG